MLLSWLRSRGALPKRPASYRPALETLDSRLVPAAHFNRASATLTDTGTLVVDFKEAGLGDTVTITEQVTANATATYACQNNGGNFPSDPKKTTVSGPVPASGDFPSGKNGQITASLTVQPPALPADFSCPPGQHVVLVAVSYTDIALTDTNNGVTVTAAQFDGLADVARTFFNI